MCEGQYDAFRLTSHYKSWHYPFVMQSLTHPKEKLIKKKKNFQDMEIEKLKYQ